MLQKKKKLSSRFADRCTVPGTRSFHHFWRWHYYKRFSCDQITKKFIISCQEALSYTETSIKTIGYAFMIFFWWVGLCLEIDTAQSDLKIQFFHPHGPAKISFMAYTRVPNNILCKRKLQDACTSFKMMNII